MKSNHPKINWLVDAVLLAGFGVTCWLDLTGVTAHEWLGLAITLLAGYHLITHWTWVKSVTARFFKQTSLQARVYYLLDASLLLGFAFIGLTGLVISTWLSLTLTNYAVWKDLHVLGSLVTLLLIVLKISLHAQWVIGTVKRYFLPSTNQPMPVRVQTANALHRREFLRLMGFVGVAMFVPMTNAIDALVQSASQENSVAQNASATVPTQTQQSTLSNTSSNSNTIGCTVRCNKSCTYPGRCRKYVDSNKNNRCDLGECVTI